MRRLVVVSALGLLLSAVAALPAAAATTVTLAEDHVGEYVISSASNFTLNCNGFAIRPASPADTFGVLIIDSTNVTVKNCDISGFKIGVSVEESSSAVSIRNNHIHHNDWKGVQLVSVSGNEVRNNLVVDNLVSPGEDEPLSFGIELQHADNNAVSGNTVTGHKNEQINLFGSDSNEVRGNTVMGGQAGIVLPESSSNLVQDNSAGGYLFGGFGVGQAGNDNTLKGNHADGDGNGFGFTVHGSTGNLLKGNTAIDGIIGFSLDWAAAFNTLEGNEASGNDIQFAVESSLESGVLAHSEGNVLSNNVASGGFIGFFVRSSEDTTLRNNSASGALGNGFSIEGSDMDSDYYRSNGAILTSNTATGNGNRGFMVSDSWDVTLSGNQATDNAERGFLIRQGSDRSTIENNVAEGNGDDGILVRDSTGTTVRNNRTRRNVSSGLAIWNMTGATVTSNRSDRNGGGFSVYVTDEAPSVSVLSQNTACHNEEFDGVDWSLSLGETDTATWINNMLCDGLFIVQP